ncbi:cytochrome P450 [Melittangium boletus]|uniref:Cytochrome P450 n=1 Tax=Melittangium boletus DSM 14713 TaxID=1294270 RepID=A0A250IGX1_9BACT|nr:cytochrome P450 [Melittangium boletus]ATB30470.1 cytochrome P450 [Melittangium boletus DSM 14713]
MTTSTLPLAPMPPGHWLLGHLRERETNPLGLFLRGREQLGDVVRFRMGPQYVEQLAHPDHVKHVLADASARYTKGSIFAKTRPLVGNGLLTAEGEFWKRQRRLSQPAFHKDRLATLAGVITQTATEAIAGWEAPVAAGTPVPVFTEMMRLTLNVVVRALFGLDVAGQTQLIGDAFTQALEVTNRRIISPLPYVPWFYRLPTRDNRLFQRAMDTLHHTVEGLIAQRRAQARDGQSPPGEDLLGMLMTACDADTGDAFDDLQLRDEVMTLMLAGHETTATSLAWTFHLLEQNPEQEALMHEEVDQVLGGRTPTLEDLPKLRYTGCVFEEAMRLYPPIWALPRTPHEDDEVGGFRIPKGDIVLLVPYVTHRHPEFWPDPERFDPTRFLPEASRQRPRWAYLPFGGGQRQCIGNNFAMMEAQFILAMVAQRFRLRGVPGVPVEPEPLVTLRPKGPLPMHVHRRQGKSRTHLASSA